MKKRYDFSCNYSFALLLETKMNRALSLFLAIKKSQTTARNTLYFPYRHKDHKDKKQGTDPQTPRASRAVCSCPPARDCPGGQCRHRVLQGGRGAGELASGMRSEEGPQAMECGGPQTWKRQETPFQSFQKECDLQNGKMINLSF